MAILPSSVNLSGPSNMRSGRAIAQFDTSGLGRGIAQAGNALQGLGAELTQAQKERTQQENVVDVARAEAIKTKGFLDTENEFNADGDYSTFDKRAPVKTGDVVKSASDVIRDPKMRERWAIGAGTDAVRVNDAIGDKARALGKQAETAAFDEALETNRNIFVDPNVPLATQEKAKQDIEGAIQTGLKSGLLTPAEAEARRDAYIKNANSSRAQLYAQQYPSSVLSGSKVTWSGEVRPKGEMASLVARDAIAEGVPPEIALGIVQIESGFNADAQAGTSSASGLYQFTKGTGDRYGLANPKDAAANSKAGAQHTRDNINGLRSSLGREPTPGEIYLAHFSGFGAAQKLSAADPNTPTSQIFSPEAIAANKSILAGKTAGQVRDWADRKMGDAMRTAAGVDVAIVAGADQPSWFKDLTPEQRLQAYKVAESRQNELRVEARSGIEIVTQNAPAAVLNTGTYDGNIPTPKQFVDAYGPEEGAQRYQQFDTAIQTSRQAYDFRTMSTEQITQAVAAATPTSSGDGAALEAKRYDTLSNAAAQTIKAREADPSTYVRQAFPAVRSAWDNAGTQEGYQNALNLTAQAQQQIGVKNMMLLPKETSDEAVTKFKDANVPEADRIAAITGMILATPDPLQRQAVFNQLVKSGLPDITEGAVEALARGDEGAARRLFQAAIIDPSKLPGTVAETPKTIDQAIQDQVMEDGSVGDVYYGLSDGTTENFERAGRDSKLINNAVQLRLRDGESLNAAVKGAAKDLYGDVKVVNGNGAVNAQLLLKSDQDPQPILNGLEASKPVIRSAIEGALVVPSDAPTNDGTKAVIDGVTKNYADNVLNNGYFRNAGDGFVFIDPYVGAAIADKDGKPITFTMDQIVKQGAQLQIERSQQETPGERRRRTIIETPSGGGKL